MSLVLSPQCCLCYMSHGRQQKKKSILQHFAKSPPSTLYSPQHNCQPLFVSEYFLSEDKKKAQWLVLNCKHSWQLTWGYFSVFLFFGSTFVSPCTGRVTKDAGVAKRGKQSICQQGSLLDTLQERGTTPIRQAKWGMINENLDPELQPPPSPPFLKTVPDVGTITDCTQMQMHEDP